MSALALIGVKAYANQGRIDSLRTIFETEYHDKTASEILKIAAKQSFIDYDAAMALSDIALQKTRIEKNLQKQFYAHRERGFISEENNQLERALQEFEFAKSVANAMDDNRDRLTIYTDLAIVNKKLGNYKAATDYHSMTLYLAKEEGDLEMVEDNLHGLGSIFERVGDYEKALDYFLQSLEIAEKRESIQGRVMTIQAIAELYLKTKNNSQALENIENAFRLAESTNDSLIIANVLSDYGNILASLGDYDLALIKLNNSLRICESGNRKVAQARTMIEIADVYTQKGDLEKAKKFFMKCFEIEEYMPPKELASLYSALGNLEKRQEDFDKAKEYFDRSIVLLSTIKNSYLEQQNNYALYEIYKEEGNADKALGYLEGYNKLQEEILNNEKQQRIAEKRFQFEMDKTKSKLQSLAATQNKTLLIGTSVTLLMIITFMFFNNSLRKKNNQALKIKAAEIEDQNKKLTESNEVLKQFAYAAAHDLKEPLRNIGSFISLIKKRYGPDLNEEANGYMNYVVKAVKRMNDLLLDLLEFSAISTEKASNDIINIGNILDEVLYTLQDKIQEREARIEYKNDFPPIKMNRTHLALEWKRSLKTKSF